MRDKIVLTLSLKQSAALLLILEANYPNTKGKGRYYNRQLFKKLNRAISITPPRHVVEHGKRVERRIYETET